VTELSPADDAGLRAGDVIMRVNSRDISSQQDFREAIAGVRSGSMVRLYVYRAQADRRVSSSSACRSLRSLPTRGRPRGGPFLLLCQEEARSAPPSS